MDNKTLSEAFRKTIYIITLFCANKLSKTFKIYKIKPTSKLT